MNNNERDNLILRAVDGELTDEEQRRFDELCASSSDVRESLEYERQLKASCARVLQTSDAIRSRRVFAAFESALDAGAPSEDSSSSAAPRTVSRRWWAVPVAAAAAVIGLWFGGFFGNGGHVHDPAVQSLLANSAGFRSDIGVSSDHLQIDPMALISALADDKTAEVFDTEEHQERLAQCEARVREVLKRALSLPDYSKVEDVDLMAFRILEIEDGEGKIRIPHMVHSFQEREVSVFVLDEAKHQSLSKSLDNEGEGGCSSCGVVIRRRGPNILVFISVMEMAKLGDFARQL